jgi:hypothetical protein
MGHRAFQLARVVAIAVVLLLGREAQALAPPAGAVEDPNASIDKLIQKQAATRLLAAFAPDTPIDTKVAQLIDRLASRDREQIQAAITALLMLGRPAVPAIIQRMDDRREMVDVIVFENRAPNAFEAVAQYGSAQVVDGLPYVLNWITGEYFGFIDVDLGFDFKDQREADAQRDRVVAGWRGYLARLKATPQAPSKTMPARDR